MSEIIKAKNIYLQYESREILDIEELIIYEGERIGIVGQNGSGKTSILNILGGKLQVEGCQITRNGNVGLIEQILPRESVDISSYDYYTSLLQVNNKVYENMSGGEQTRYRISQSLKENPACILADEPTSHLDRKGVDLLVRELSYYTGALLIVSHDHEFLDSTVEKIWEIKDKTIREYYGNYSDYLEEKRLEREENQRDYSAYIEEKERLEKAILVKKKQADSLQGKSNKNKTLQGGRLSMQRPTGSKEKSLNKSAKNMEKRLEKLDEIKPIEMERKIVFRQSPAVKLYNNYPIMGEKIYKKLGDKLLFDNASITIPLGKKVALVGDNGQGKSTLLNMIYAREEFFTIASKAKIAYFKQVNYVTTSNESIMEYLQKDSDYRPSELIAMLVQMGFEKSDMKKSLSKLSGGELSKIFLLKILSGEYNIILMDEPSNFLDNQAVLALENMMRDYKGSIIFVSHESSLINRLADMVYEIKDGKINRIRG